MSGVDSLTKGVINVNNNLRCKQIGTHKKKKNKDDLVWFFAFLKLAQFDLAGTGSSLHFLISTPPWRKQVDLGKLLKGLFLPSLGCNFRRGSCLPRHVHAWRRRRWRGRGRRTGRKSFSTEISGAKSDLQHFFKEITRPSGFVFFYRKRDFFLLPFVSSRLLCMETHWLKRAIRKSMQLNWRRSQPRWQRSGCVKIYTLSYLNTESKKR